jgi:hypothetical protein
VVAGIVAATQTLPMLADSQVERPHRPAFATGTTADQPSLSDLTVADGTGTIDTFTTDEVPAWAREYGSNGPAAIAPDGRLWIAPGTTVVRSVADPAGAQGKDAGVSHSYALEVRTQGGLEWWYAYQDANDANTFGMMDRADGWTSDFALWAENEARPRLGLTTFRNTLVRFEDDRSAVLVPKPGIEIVDQTTDVDTGGRAQYPRRSAAEVVVDGQHYFVLATGSDDGTAVGSDGAESYEAYQAAVVGPDLQSFLDFVASGFDSQVDAS